MQQPVPPLAGQTQEISGLLRLPRLQERVCRDFVDNFFHLHCSADDFSQKSTRQKQKIIFKSKDDILARLESVMHATADMLRPKPGTVREFPSIE